MFSSKDRFVKNPAFVELSLVEFHGVAGDPSLLPLQLTPDLARSVSTFASIMDALDLPSRFGVPSGPRSLAGVASDSGVRISGRRSDRQNAADRLDSAGLAMRFD